MNTAMLVVAGVYMTHTQEVRISAELRHFEFFRRSSADIVVKAESACDVEAIGELGEVGLGQIYPKAWKNKIPKVLELSSWNDIMVPRQNLRAAAFILSDCIARKGLQKGFTCYNGRGIKAERYGASRFVEFKKFHY